MSRTPRLDGELDAVLDAESLLESSQVVARLAARHPDAGMSTLMGALFAVLVAEVGVRLGEPDAAEHRDTSVTGLLSALEKLPDGQGPKLLDWRTNHVVARLLRAAWRDHAHLGWSDYQAALD